MIPPTNLDLNHFRSTERKRLKQIRTLSDAVKAVIYEGNQAGAPMAIQFHRDLHTYGLWEALLYVENYERTGDYTRGTAVAALLATRIPEDEELPSFSAFGN